MAKTSQKNTAVAIRQRHFQSESITGIILHNPYEMTFIYIVKFSFCNGCDGHFVRIK